MTTTKPSTICPECGIEHASRAPSGRPHHLHCDHVLLAPSGHSKGLPNRYSGSWSRGMNISIHVSRLERRRETWRAELWYRETFEPLVEVEASTPEAAASRLTNTIDVLRRAFGRRGQWL